MALSRHLDPHHGPAQGLHRIHHLSGVGLWFPFRHRSHRGSCPFRACFARHSIHWPWSLHFSLGQGQSARKSGVLDAGLVIAPSVNVDGLREPLAFGTEQLHVWQDIRTPGSAPNDKPAAPVESDPRRDHNSE